MSRLDELKALLEKATPGPWGWTYDGSNDYSVGRAEDPQAKRVAVVYDPTERDGADAALIALLRNMAPDLLRVVEAAQNLAECEFYNDDACDAVVDALKALEG